MKLLVFSDLHNDFHTAAKLVELSNTVDVVVGAGDFCVARQGLDEIIAIFIGDNQTDGRGSRKQ